MTLIEIMSSAAAGEPIAKPARAQELALLDELSLLEFTELTGVGAGAFGMYRVEREGVQLISAGQLEDWTPAQQIEIQRAEKTMTLQFPCSPERFLDWYDATRGTNGKSDFPLAPEFESAVRRQTTSSASARPSVPSREIIDAFKVKPLATDNKEWWDSRLRNPGRYSLESARASQGRVRIPSRWYPDVVAAWLIEKSHLSRPAVIGAMQQHFPQVDRTLLT